MRFVTEHSRVSREAFLDMVNATDTLANDIGTLLEGEARVEEAARILGGINITDAQRQAARDMLSNCEE